MTDEEQTLSNEFHRRIRRNWARVAPISEEMSRVFYANLFRLDPSTVPLFRGDMDLQGRKLVQTLGFIVDHLDDLETLLPVARDLAIRHVSYGVAKEQYASVGEALIASLRKLLGSGFSPEDEDAWTKVYGTLSGEMVKSAYPA